MASRSLDGKVALLFKEGREPTSTPGRHLADRDHAAGLGTPGVGEKGGSRSGSARLGSPWALRKKIRFPESCEA